MFIPYMTRTTANIVRGNKLFQKPIVGTCCHLPKKSYLSGIHSAWSCDCGMGQKLTFNWDAVSELFLMFTDDTEGVGHDCIACFVSSTLTY